MSGIFTVPATTTIATTEELPIGFDFSANVAAGDTVTSPVSLLHNPDSGATITPTDSPTVLGNVVTQIVRGSQLTAKQVLRLDVTATLNAAKIITASLYISCPY